VLAHASRHASSAVNDLVNEFPTTWPIVLCRPGRLSSRRRRPSTQAPPSFPMSTMSSKLRGAGRRGDAGGLRSTSSRPRRANSYGPQASKAPAKSLTTPSSRWRPFCATSKAGKRGPSSARQKRHPRTAATVEGQRLLRNIDLPSIRRARKFFRAALASASNHVPAMAGLSRSYVMEWLVRAPFEASLLEEAEQCARKGHSRLPGRSSRPSGTRRRRYVSASALMTASNFSIAPSG